MNPEGLLNKIITGDENALRQLFEQYSQRLYHVAYYYLQAKEPAEEAVLDVFTTVWKKRESLGHIKTIEQYSYSLSSIRLSGSLLSGINSTSYKETYVLSGE